MASLLSLHINRIKHMCWNPPVLPAVSLFWGNETFPFCSRGRWKLNLECYSHSTYYPSFTHQRPLYVLYMLYPTHIHLQSPIDRGSFLNYLFRESTFQSPNLSVNPNSDFSVSSRTHIHTPALDSVWAVTGIRLPCRKWTAGTNDNPSLFSLTLLEQNLYLIKNWLILICQGVWGDEVWVKERLVYFYFALFDNVKSRAVD